MSDSRFAKKAKRLLDGVKGRALTIEERRELAVELASYILNEARRTQTTRERKRQLQMARMMRDPSGQAFTFEMTDQCFRSHDAQRVVDQLVYLIKKHGIPHFLPLGKKMKLLMVKWFGNALPRTTLFFAKRAIRKETSHVILPGETGKLKRSIKKRRRQGMRVNLNHLGEAILGEDEAERQLQIYLQDLKRPEVEMISVKISSICSQLNLLALEETLSLLIPRLKLLYMTAYNNPFVGSDGKRVPKCVNLDMEAYEDLHLTVELFQRVLDEPEFQHQYAGIVLQAYIPESYLIQQKLTVWAKQRVANGGAPIRLRLVKGANLSMEKLVSSLNGWNQAPYSQKSEVDGNFKRMLQYGCDPENAWAVHLGVGSHNLFDIAYSLLLRVEREVEQSVCIEMLEGMAPSIQRVVRALAGDLLVYAPAATQADFQNAVAYLVRRLDENSGKENFIHYLFKMMPGTKEWQQQANLFSYACHQSRTISMNGQRTQNRTLDEVKPSLDSPFQNEAFTDWSLPHHRKWAESILAKWKENSFEPIPESDETHVDQALSVASYAPNWSASMKERATILAEVASQLRKKRADLIGAMVFETKKTVQEADIEIAEAIDFVEYYRRSGLEWNALEGIEWSAKGVIVVASPWNFPCSIPVGGIAAALIGGNRVIFKPAPEARLVGWHLLQAFWEAGVDREVLQYLPCGDDPAGRELIFDARVDAVVLTGATTTALEMLKMHPGLDLMGETGGKNSMIVTRMADRDLAIHDVIASAFGHSGQKCSACSLLVLEAELYDDAHFMRQLSDAAKSLKVGPAYELASQITPLIRNPSEPLKKALTKLESGESWALEPNLSTEDPTLWSPGIKLGVKEGSFFHQTECFGPVLGVMRADSLEHALKIVNGTPYGLTAGLHSLDEREQKLWKSKVRAGNLYINRTITGAIVRRQPFGGCKASSFGPGAKAGGPHYVPQMMQPRETAHPDEKEIPDPIIDPLTQHLKRTGYENGHLSLWRASIGSYSWAWKHTFSQKHDPTGIPGQKNLLYYVPRPLLYRVHPEDDHLDILRVIAAALTCACPLEVSGDPIALASISKAEWEGVRLTPETDEVFCKRILPKHIRLTKEPTQNVLEALSHQGCSLLRGPVLAHGQLELLHYLREVSLSHDTHRYGHLSGV